MSSAEANTNKKYPKDQEIFLYQIYIKWPGNFYIKPLLYACQHIHYLENFLDINNLGLQLIYREKVITQFKFITTAMIQLTKYQV